MDTTDQFLFIKVCFLIIGLLLALVIYEVYYNHKKRIRKLEQRLKQKEEE